MENRATQWRKSSYSSDQGGDCIECAPLGPITWRKSSYSSDQGGECLEIADTPCATVAVRDSKTPTGPRLSFQPEAFEEFLQWATTAE